MTIVQAPAVMSAPGQQDEHGEAETTDITNSKLSADTPQDGGSSGSDNSQLKDSHMQEQKEHFERLEELHRQILIEQRKIQQMAGATMGTVGLDFNGAETGIGTAAATTDGPADLLNGTEVTSLGLSPNATDGAGSSASPGVQQTPSQASSSTSSATEEASTKDQAKDATAEDDGREKRRRSWKKKWHSERDVPFRRETIRRIAELLLQRKRNPEPKWKSELPFKARRLEEQLYKSASSFEEYVNDKTLRHRLKVVATAIATKFREAKRQQRALSGAGTAGGGGGGGSGSGSGSGSSTTGSTSPTASSMRDLFAKPKQPSGDGSLSSLLNSLNSNGTTSIKSGPGGKMPNSDPPNNSLAALQSSLGTGVDASAGDLGGLGAGSFAGSQHFGQQQPHTSQNLQDQILMSLKAKQRLNGIHSSTNNAINFGQNSNTDATSSLMQQQLLRQQQNQFMDASVTQSPHQLRASLGGGNGSLAELMGLNQSPASHRQSLAQMLSPAAFQQLAQLDALNLNNGAEQQQQQQSHLQLPQQLLQRHAAAARGAAGSDMIGVPMPNQALGQQLDPQQLLLLQQQQQLQPDFGLSAVNNLALGNGLGVGHMAGNSGSGGADKRGNSFDHNDFNGVPNLNMTPESFGW